jgi:hypothetical protein
VMHGRKEETKKTIGLRFKPEAQKDVLNHVI